MSSPGGLLMLVLCASADVEWWCGGGEEMASKEDMLFAISSLLLNALEADDPPVSTAGTCPPFGSQPYSFKSSR